MLHKFCQIHFWWSVVKLNQLHVCTYTCSWNLKKNNQEIDCYFIFHNLKMQCNLRYGNWITRLNVTYHNYFQNLTDNCNILQSPYPFEMKTSNWNRWKLISCQMSDIKLCGLYATMKLISEQNSKNYHLGRYIYH